MSVQSISTVSDMRPVAKNVFSITFDAPEIAKIAEPGQFVHIKCGHSRALRRPISISNVDGSRLTVVFEVRGAGTRWLAGRSVGRRVDILGPLGRGFGELSGNTIVVGGGIGAAPMLFAAKTAATVGNVAAVLGFRSRDNVILTDDFAAYGTVVTTTDDGSFGTHGTVAAPLEALIKSGNYENVLACGPRPMLRAVAELSETHGIACHVSMEERMGCGIGACVVCVCKTQTEEGEKMSRVCKDGPVFDSREVVW